MTRYAARVHHCTNPIADVELPKKEKHELDLYNKNEQNRLKTALLTNMDLTKLGIMIALYTGGAQSEEELAGWDGTWEDFFRIWTIKEAYVKYRGGSIFPPKEVPAQPPVPHCSYAGDGWRAALCGEGELPREIEWIDW